jgi:hypothetical protein
MLVAHRARATRELHAPDNSVLPGQCPICCSEDQLLNDCVGANHIRAALHLLCCTCCPKVRFWFLRCSYSVQVPLCFFARDTEAFSPCPPAVSCADAGSCACVGVGSSACAATGSAVPLVLQAPVLVLLLPPVTVLVQAPVPVLPHALVLLLLL